MTERSISLLCPDVGRRLFLYIDHWEYEVIDFQKWWKSQQRKLKQFQQHMAKCYPLKWKPHSLFFTLPPSKVNFLSFLVTYVCGPSRIGRDSIFEFCFQYFLRAFFIFFFFFFSSLPSKRLSDPPIVQWLYWSSSFVDYIVWWTIVSKQKKKIVKLCNFLLILFILFKLIFLSDLSLAQMYNHLCLQWRTAAEAWHNWVWRICAQFQCPFCWWKIWIAGHVSCKRFARFSIYSILYLSLLMNFCIQHGKCLYCCSWKPLDSIWGYPQYPKRCTKVLLSTC